MQRPQTLEIGERVSVAASDDRTSRLTRAILSDLFGPLDERSFAVRLWDGTTEVPGSRDAPRFTLVLCHPGSLRRMLLPPSELTMARAYVSGHIDFEGDLEAASTLADLAASRLRSVKALTRLMTRVLALPSTRTNAQNVGAKHHRWRWLGRPHSQRRDAAAVRFHYDVGNEFFELFLDRRMVYSCAYFPPGTQDIEAAQEAKLDLICRKLRLEQGECLLDLGCGWGGLIIYAAQQYGVHALGVTLSEAQAALARERIAATGLGDRCHVKAMDYRALPPGMQFDKVSSVGMLEHLGRAQLDRYFTTAHRLVREGGLLLTHTLTRGASGRPRSALNRIGRHLWRRGQFLQRYVFPDVQPLRVGEVIESAERVGFETRDVENLRDHYAKTARAWVRRLESRHDDAVAILGEASYRVWRLYMAAGARAQASGHDGIVQILLAKPDRQGRTGLPLSRADLYRR